MPRDTEGLAPPPAATRRAVVLACLVAALGTLAAILWNHGIAHRRAMHALVDADAASVGDPWPTVVAARRLAADRRTPLYQDFTIEGSSFIYPPLAALPYAALLGGDDAAVRARLVWTSRLAWLSILVLAAALSMHRVRPTLLHVCFLAWAGIAFFPLVRALQLNQASLWVAVCVGASALAAQRGRPRSAGMLMAAAAVFKPQLALAPLLLLLCARSVALPSLLTLAVAGVASIVYAGIANHVRYVTEVAPRLAGGYAYYPNQSWHAFLLRLAGADPSAFALPTVAPWVAAAGAIATGATVVLGAFVLWRARVGAARADVLPLTILFAWLVATLASPISWEHHHVPALFAFAWLLRAAMAGELSRWTILCAGVAAPAIAGHVDVRGWSLHPIAVVGMSYTLWGDLLLALAMAQHVRKASRVDALAPRATG